MNPGASGGKDMVLKKRDLQRLNLGGKIPRCPLCHDWMERHYTTQGGYGGIFVFKCDRERIAIRVDDPFVGKWEQALEKQNPNGIECPRPGCGTKVRYFATSVGFAMIKCPKPKCGMTMKMGEIDRKTDTPDRFYTPEEPGALQ